MSEPKMTVLATHREPADLGRLTADSKREGGATFTGVVDRERAQLSEGIALLGREIGDVRGRLNKAVAARFDLQRQMQRLDDEIGAMRHDEQRMVRLLGDRRRALLELEISTSGA